MKGYLAAFLVGFVAGSAPWVAWSLWLGLHMGGSSATNGFAASAAYWLDDRGAGGRRERR